MRISDWSSDVCSSDLRPAAISPALFTAVERAMADYPAIASSRVSVRASRADLRAAQNRSEERRVGQECGSTGKFRWSPYPLKTKKSNALLELLKQDTCNTNNTVCRGHEDREAT